MPVINYNFQGSGAGAVKTQLQEVDRAAKRSEAESERRAKKLRKNRARRRLQRIREAKRAAQAEARAEQRIETKRISDLQKFEQKRWREAKRAQDKLNRERRREQRKQLREAERFAKREAQAQAKAAEAARAKRAGRIRGAGVAIGRGALGLAGAAATAVTGATLTTANAAVRQQITLEEKARGLAVQARGAGEALADPKMITKRAQQTAIDVGGVTAESVIDAMSTFVTRTGRFDLAESMSETFATAARATGAHASDIAGAAADLFEKFDIKTIDGMQDALASLTFQGKKGAFELADAASQFPRLAAAAGRLGLGKGVGAVRQLGGLTQIARQATGGPEQAATALEAVFTGLTTQQKALGRHKVDVFDKKTGAARDIQAVLTDVVSKVGGSDIAKKKGELAKIFGRQGIRALSPLISAYANATGDAKAKTEAVAAALRDAIDAPGTWNDVVEDAAIQNEALSSRMTTAWEQIVAASGETLTPAITELAETLANFLTEGGGLEAIAFAFDVVAENAKFLAEAFGEVAATLQDLGLIEGPTPGKIIEREQKKQQRLDKRVAAVEAARAPLIDKTLTGTLTDKEWDKLRQLDEKRADLEEQKSESRAKVAAAEAQIEKPFEGARAAATGAYTDVPMFTREEFAKQFAAAAGARSMLEGGAMGMGSVFKSDEENQREYGRNIADAIARGEQVPTFGYSEAQQRLIGELGGQVEAIRQGAVAGAGPETVGMQAIGEKSAAAAEGMSAAGAAAVKLAGKMNAVPQPGAGDVG